MKFLLIGLNSRQQLKIVTRRFYADISKHDRFPILNYYVDTVSSRYAEVYKENRSVSKTVRDYKSKARSGGGERAIKRHTEINKKLLVRDRLSLLLDSPVEENFFEIAPLAGCLGLEYGSVPSAGVVSGIGSIRGRKCFVMANDATVKGGTVYPITVKKQLRGQELAQMLRMPCIYIVDSGGAFLPLQVSLLLF
jgi:3-methylcrotonyl-CoA carboxylase beta subunit